MVLENFQELLYIITLILAAITAVVGYRAVHLLWKHKEQLQLAKSTLVSFTLIAVGYILFGLGELSWYLIYGFIQKLPSASVPDMYWVLGTVALLLGFVIFTIANYRQHGQLGQGLLLQFLIGIIAAGLLYYVLSSGVVSERTSEFQQFLGYYYPIVSALILTASASLYLFYEKLHTAMGGPMLFFLLANVGHFLGDVMYTYYTFKDIYGLLGVISDGLYVLAYATLILAFWMLAKNVKGSVESE